MIYVLILIIGGFRSASAVSHIEFQTREACEAAGAQAMLAAKRVQLNPAYVCAPKG
jgi:hypothetical protein